MKTTPNTNQFLVHAPQASKFIISSTFFLISHSSPIINLPTFKLMIYKSSCPNNTWTFQNLPFLLFKLFVPLNLGWIPVTPGIVICSSLPRASPP